MLHWTRVDPASPHRGAHIAEEAADVLQQRALMLMVRLGCQAVGCLMLSAEQPASQISAVLRSSIPLQDRAPQVQHQPLPAGTTAPKDMIVASCMDCPWDAGGTPDEGIGDASEHCLHDLG